jgi:hypothetical protein
MKQFPALHQEQRLSARNIYSKDEAVSCPSSVWPKLPYLLQHATGPSSDLKDSDCTL